jgi:hypothetical protein
MARQACIARDAGQALQLLLRTLAQASTETDFVTKPACMPGQTTSSQCHCANDSRSRDIIGNIPFVALHCSYMDRQACCLPQQTRVEMYRCLHMPEWLLVVLVH